MRKRTEEKRRSSLKLVDEIQKLKLMTDQILPQILDKILSDTKTPDDVFSALLPALGEVLNCDRVFLYLRNPETQRGRVPYCWRRNSNFPEIGDAEWKKEPESLGEEDPLFAAALRTEPSIFVEDVETANPEVVNKNFEAKEFGHRALIHAHLCADGLLWGVLQPCMFDLPRVWTDFDRQVIAAVTEKISPLAVAYVTASASKDER
ncbi:MULTISPECIES: GAF domain-containing protein [unclassified Microcoleus]|uniref:GAF domain-containing protein n=1 Tax=unclassified Microcoleus TaxID=2642155 RepID=UPI002FD05C4D